jgi:hypothetical protein
LGYYSSDDPTIVAVSWANAEYMPCATPLQVCGPSGCHLMMRKDTCPGCVPNGFDLSEAGIALVCGDGAPVCWASVTKLAPCENVAPVLPPEASASEPPDEATQLSYLLTPELHLAPAPTAPAPPCAPPPSG